jgi:hypothetical protein
MAETYQRLPGKGLRRGTFLIITATRSRLFLGPDHLLMADSNGYVETYKRFAYRDIQSCTITRTRRRAIWNGIWLSLAGLMLLFGLLINHVAGWVFFGPLAALFGLLAVVNTLRGPTCRCVLTTAVQAEELPSLGRIPRAEKVLTRVTPLLVQAQTPASS